MPWTSPTLKQLRGLVRDYIQGRLPGADALIPNSVLRVLADCTAAMTELVIQYLDWQSLQYLPDTAETQFLDRWGNIKLINADGSKGRKQPTFATGTIAISGGVQGTIIPAGTEFYVTIPVAPGQQAIVNYQTLAQVTVGADGTAQLPAEATDSGSVGNIAQGTSLNMLAVTAGIGVPSAAANFTGGTDQETDDELRIRVLDALSKPPMGGDADDYVQWALSFPGVTRAWTSPLEMGIGTVTLRFMMDDLRASNAGFPMQADVDALATYLGTVRPVTVEDLFVVAPIPEPISFTIFNLTNDNISTWTNIENSVTAMLRLQASPAYAVDGTTQPATTIWSVWVADAVLQADGVVSFDISMADHPMPNNGCLAVLGNVIRGDPQTALAGARSRYQKAGASGQLPTARQRGLSRSLY